MTKEFRLHLGLLALIFLAFALRLHALLELPAYVDEGLHLQWAVGVLRGQLIFPFSVPKPFGVYYIAAFLPFQNTPASTLWVGRASSVLVSPVMLSGLVALGRSWGRPRVGVLAALLYTLIPLTFFHERLAIADPLAAAGAVWLTWGATQWAKRRPTRRRRWSIALAGGLFALLLVKYSGLPVLAIPLVVVVLDENTRKAWRPTLRQIAGPYVVAGIGLALVLGISHWRYGILGEYNQRSAIGTPAWMQLVLSNIGDVVDWSGYYLGLLALPLVLGIIVALVAHWRAPMRGGNALSWLALAGLLLSISPFVLVAGGFPRYYLPSLAFAVVLAAGGLLHLGDLLRSAGLRRGVGLILLIALGVLPFGQFVAQAYRAPAQLDLPRVDVTQYISDWSSGYGIREATAYIAEQIAHDPRPAIVYSADLATWTAMWVYWPANANGDIYEVWNEHGPSVIDVMAANEHPVYLVVDSTISKVDFTGLPIYHQELARFERPAGGLPIIIYRLSSTPF